MIKEITQYELLIIEDNEGDVLLIEEYLSDFSPIPKLVHAVSLRDATILFEEGAKFDAVLLDLTLPDATGEELVERVVRLAGDAPVIILTGYTNHEFGIRAGGLGIADYLHKDDLTPYILIKSVSYSVERSRINAHLKQSEHQYRELFDFNPLPMWVFDLETLRFVNVNEAAIRHYGYTREEFLGMTILGIRPEEYHESTIEDVYKTRDSKQYIGGSTKHSKKNGEIIDVEIRASEIVYGGRPSKLILANDTTELKIYQENLIKSLREKETLLSEIHHRVKNNLAIVSGMMQLQAFQDENEDIKTKLLDSVSRIQTMATIHEHLYRSHDFSKINFPDNLNSLINNIIMTFKTDLDLKLDFECADVNLNINQAIPCSLIINEVVTNILKHAFPGRSTGLLKVNLKETDGELILNITDNGVGLPDDFSATSDDTLGLLLIKILSEQLGGDYEYEWDKNGTTFKLTFQIKLDLPGAASSLV